MASSTDGPYANVDVTTLSQHDASEYRQELYNVIYYEHGIDPGAELEVIASGSGADMEFYKKKLKEVDTYLATFPEKI
jgi:hypothetical protein